MHYRTKCLWWSILSIRWDHQLKFWVIDSKKKFQKIVLATLPFYVFVVDSLIEDCSADWPAVDLNHQNYCITGADDDDIIISRSLSFTFFFFVSFCAKPKKSSCILIDDLSRAELWIVLKKWTWRHFDFFILRKRKKKEKMFSGDPTKGQLCLTLRNCKL